MPAAASNIMRAIAVVVASAAAVVDAFHVPLLPAIRWTFAPSYGLSASLVAGDADDTSRACRGCRRTYLEGVGAGVLGAVAWSLGAGEAQAINARPAAKGLAETSIELTGSGKEPVEVTLLYPSKWIVTKYPGTSISIQDYSNAARAFSLSVPLPGGKQDIDDLPIEFYTDAIFDLNGPYGTFGKVDDFKVLGTKTLDKGKRKYRYVDLKFAALTQGLLQKSGW